MSQTSSFKRAIAFLLAAITSVLVVTLTSPLKSSAADGGKIFQAQCAGCHPGGGNKFNPNKALAIATLRKDGYSSVSSIVRIVSNGKNKMPAYKNRLSSQEIQTVSTYVLERAKKNWK
jgi:cytochrome c6